MNKTNGLLQRSKGFFVFRFSLNQLLLLTVIASLLPISVLSIIQGLSNRDRAQDLIAERLIANATASAALQSEPISTTRKLIETLAMDRDVATMSAGCGAQITRMMGVEIPVDNIVRVDAGGTVKCSAAGRPVSNYVGQRVWWQAAMKARKFTVSGPFVSRSSGEPSLYAVLPLYGADGESIGSIHARIGLDSVSDLLARTTLSPNAVAAIADARGKIVTATKAGFLPAVDIAASLATAATARSSDGTPWLYASSPVFEQQMFVIYAEPQAPLLASARGEFRATLMLPLLAILLTTIAVWVGVNRLAVRWLRDLGLFARQIGAGDHLTDPTRFARAPREIAALGADLRSMSAAIAARNEALETAAATARTLSREVNHRVKNNLQMVMSLLSLQTAKVKDPQGREALDQTRLRMGALALIHRLLYDLGDDADKGLVDMDRLLTELSAQLRKTIGTGTAIVLECFSDVGRGRVDTAIPVAMFVVEAVANSYRHGFIGRPTGKIAISFVRDSNAFILSITDNGIGYDDDVQRESMGIELMRAFSAQLNGTMTIVNDQDGVAIELSYAAPL